jgi:hypothetical protein
MTDDDDLDPSLAHNVGQRLKVVPESAPGDPSHRLAGDAERIGKGESDPHGSEVDREDPAPRFRQ